MVLICAKICLHTIGYYYEYLFKVAHFNIKMSKKVQNRSTVLTRQFNTNQLRSNYTAISETFYNELNIVFSLKAHTPRQGNYISMGTRF